jgi:sulfopropanediol 3-dehydrogenase
MTRHTKFAFNTSGTDHILPTDGATRYCSGLNMIQFIKVLPWTQLDRSASKKVADVPSRIS